MAFYIQINRLWADIENASELILKLLYLIIELWVNAGQSRLIVIFDKLLKWEWRRDWDCEWQKLKQKEKWGTPRSQKHSVNL